MYKPIQIESDVGMQILDHLRGKFPWSLLIFGDGGDVVFLEMFEEELALLVVGIAIKLGFEFKDFYFFRGNSLVDGCLHPFEEGIYHLGVLKLNWFGFWSKICLWFEFLPQLLAPFGQNSQNGRALYDQVLTFYLLLRIGKGVLGYLSPYQIMSILFYLLLIFKLLSLCAHFFGDISGLRISPICLGPWPHHPFFIIDIFKQVRHKALKISKVCFLFVSFLFFLLCVGHEWRLLGNLNRLVDDSHNHIIVVAIGVIFEHDSKRIKEVIR